MAGVLRDISIVSWESLFLTSLPYTALSYYFQVSGPSTNRVWPALAAGPAHSLRSNRAFLLCEGRSFLKK